MISELDIRKINGRGEPDFAIPIFLTVGWNTRVPRITSYSKDNLKEGGQFKRMTLDAARADVAKVKAGQHFHKLEPNCIIRVYLK